MQRWAWTREGITRLKIEPTDGAKSIVQPAGSLDVASIDQRRQVQETAPAVTQKGAWVALTVGVFGLAMSLAVVARGGGYFLVVSHLALVLPLAVVERSPGWSPRESRASRRTR